MLMLQLTHQHKATHYNKTLHAALSNTNNTSYMHDKLHASQATMHPRNLTDTPVNTTCCTTTCTAWLWQERS